MSNALNPQTQNDSVLAYYSDLEKITEQLILSNDIFKLDTIKEAIHKIHSLRRKSSQHEKSINAGLFELFKKCLSASNETIKQGSTVAFLSGFENHPVSDSEDAKALIFAMSNSPNLQYTLPMIQRITLNLAKDYEKKLKPTDSDMSCAHMLKDFTEYCYWKKQKKRISDNNWAYTITHTLADVYPTPDFQRAANAFQYKSSPHIENKVHLPEEFTAAYSNKPSIHHNHLSREYEKD